MSSVIERTLKGGAGFFTANVIKRGFGFLFVVVASRLLGPAEFGVLALGLSVMGLSRRIAAFGLPNTVQRFLSGEAEERGPKLYGAVLLTAGVTACIAGGGLAIAAPWLSAFFDEPTLTTPLRVLSVGLVLGTGFMMFRAVLQAQEQIRRIMVVDTVRSAAKAGLVFVLLFFVARSATTAAWAIVGAFGLAGGVAVFYVSQLEVWPTFRIRREDLRIIASYSAPLVVVGFSYFLARQADRLMLGWLADASSVGVYTVTSKLAVVMGTLHGALVSIFKPIASEAYRNDATRQMRRSYLFISKWVGAINGVALLTFAGAGPWLLRIFGTEYATSTTYHVLIILAALFFIGTWVGPTGALLQMSDGHRVELVNTVVFVVANVILNYAFILAYGVVGAAMGTFLSGMLRNGLQVCELAFWHGITPFARSNLAVLGITTIGTGMLLMASTNIGRVGLAIVGAVTLSIYVLWTATEEERGALWKLASDVTASAQ
jgi:O-antigen/teichoic acid export membrane protein